MILHFSIRLASLPIAVSVLIVLNAHATITGVDEASDVCPATSDPCIVSDRVEFVTGSVLDFGLRKLEVRGGVLDVGAANITVLCGDFSTTSGETPAIVLGNPDPFGATPRLRLEARRACSDAPAVPCLRDLDCSAGTCSVGNGTIDLGGRIGSAGQRPGRIRMISAGDFTVRATATANSGNADVDGGELDFESMQGSLLIDGRMWARSAALGSGGDLWLTADKDLTLNAPLNAGGGDFDGGFIDIIAGEVATINASIKANAAWGGGSGGVIGVDATSIELARGVKILANGHHGPDFGGDGGEIDFVANHFVSHEDTVISARGAGPDGYGGFVDIEVYGDVVVASTIRAGGFGGGGLMLLTAVGSFTLTEASRVDGDARKGYSTEMFISGGTRLEMHGRISTSSGPAASRGGSANVLRLNSDGDVIITGRIDLKGSAASFFPRRLAIEGCNITLADGSRVRNYGDPGEVELEGRELIHVEPAASIRADRGNVSVRFVHRDGGPVPLIEGRVRPAPVIEADSTLTACTP